MNPKYEFTNFRAGKCKNPPFFQVPKPKIEEPNSGWGQSSRIQIPPGFQSSTPIDGYLPREPAVLNFIAGIYIFILALSLQFILYFLQFQ